MDDDEVMIRLVCLAAAAVSAIGQSVNGGLVVQRAQKFEAYVRGEERDD